MKLINYISSISIPMIILSIIVYGIKEKKNVYDLFILGVKDGIKVVIKLFPTLLAIFLAIGMLRNSGAIEQFTNFILIITKGIKIPSEIIPLALLRPISGSASLACATDIMKTYGVDTTIGKIASTIMGSTETTLYIISIYTNSVGIRKTRFILFSALIADFVGITSSIIIWNLIS